MFRGANGSLAHNVCGRDQFCRLLKADIVCDYTGELMVAPGAVSDGIKIGVQPELKGRSTR